MAEVFYCHQSQMLCSKLKRLKRLKKNQALLLLNSIVKHTHLRIRTLYAIEPRCRHLPRVIRAADRLLLRQAEVLPELHPPRAGIVDGAIEINQAVLNPFGL